MKLACLLVAALAQEPGDPDVLSGIWRGGIVHEGSIEVVALEILPAAAPRRARLTIEGLQWYRTPIEVSADLPDLRFSWEGSSAHLRLDELTAELRGTARVAGVDVRMHLTRARRPGPHGLVQEDVAYASADGTRLAGTLHLPDAPGPHPAILLVHGRGYGPRQGWELPADHFASHGIVALTFDGRGYGGSGGSPSEAVMTKEHRITDVLAGLEVLASHEAVDAGQIGVMAESTGCWVAAEALGRTARVAFLVFQVGPVVDVVEQQAHATRYSMVFADEEYSDFELDTAQDVQRSIFRAIVDQDETAWEELQPVIEQVRTERWGQHLHLPAALDADDVRFFALQDYDPEPEIAELRIPLLAIYGESDFIVPPQANVPRLERLMEQAGNDNWRVVVYPGVGHSLRYDSGMRGAGSAWPDRHFQWNRPVPGLYDGITDWVLEQVVTATELDR